MRDPLVSALVATSNRAPMLGDALDSIDAQTYRPLEVVIVDDGSDDDTPGVIETFTAATDCSVTTLRNATPSGGPARPYQQAFDAAEGDYIALLQDDDHWYSEKIERQVRAFERASPSIGLVYTGKRRVYRRALAAAEDSRLPLDTDTVGETVTPTWGDDIDADDVYLRCAIPSPSAVLIDADYIAAIGGWDPSLPVHDDWDLWIRLLDVCEFMSIDAALIVQGIHDGQLFRDADLMDRYRERFLDKHEHRFRERGLYDRAWERHADIMARR